MAAVLIGPTTKTTTTSLAKILDMVETAALLLQAKWIEL
jgi:hypothetical protein